MNNVITWMVIFLSILGNANAQTYKRVVGPANASDIVANGFGPIKLDGQSVNQVATYYDACELGLRKKGFISQLKYTLSAPIAIGNGETVEVWMKNSTRCDLNELDPWNNVTGNVHWMGNCSISPSTSTADVIISLPTPFAYDGEGLEIYFQLSASMSASGFQSFMSPGNVQTWNNGSPIWYTGMIKPIVEFTYSLPTISQNYTSSALTILTCDGDQSFCNGEEVCMSLDYSGVAGQLLNADFFADNSLSFRWQFAPSSSPTNYSLINQPAITYIAQNYVASSALYSDHEEIVNVTLGALNNSSACGSIVTGANSVSGKYSNYTDGSVIPNIPNVSTNSSSISISVASCGAGLNAYCAAYIDYNHDGDFSDSDENIFASGIITTASPVSGTFSAPLSAINGWTRLRVICSSGSLVAPDVTYGWGETEDYWVNIIDCASASTSMSFVPAGAGNVRCRVFDNSSGVNFFVGPISITESIGANNLSCFEEPELGEEVGSRITRVVLSKKDSVTDEFVPLLISNTNGTDGMSPTAFSLEVRTDLGQPLQLVNWNPEFNASFNHADFSMGMFSTGFIPQVRAGDEVKLELKMNKAAKPSMFNHVARMEFDWDGDNDFETFYYFDYSEGTPLFQVPAGQSDQPIVLIGPASSSIEYAKTIAVPCTVLANVTTKFRVTLKKLPTGWDDGEDYAIKTLCPIPRITYVGTPVICSPDSKILNAVLNCPAAGTYQWKKNGVNISGATNSSYTATTSGSYSVVFTNAAGTCSEESDPVVLTTVSLAAPVITASGALTFCQGGSVGLSTATTYSSYAWSNGATTSSIIANATGTYSVTVTDINGCIATSATTNVNVTPYVTPSINILASLTSICAGDLVTFTASVSNAGSPPGYQWKINGSNVGGNASTFSDSGLSNGDQVSCILTANNTCQTVNTATSNVIVMSVATALDYYMDNDGDGYGAGTATNACSSPGSGFVTNNTDCDDSNAALHTISTEVCNGSDDDCDGLIDDGLIFLNYYADNDGDGYGAGTATNACISPGSGFVSNNTDCDDSNAALHTISTEVCNGTDDDCDGFTDDGLIFLNYYADNDGDGYGAGTATSACSPIAGMVTTSNDCNNAVSAIHPGMTEICNGIDDDCDFLIDEGCSGTGLALLNATIMATPQLGTSNATNTHVVNMAGQGDTPECPGAYNEKWFKFTAVSNAIRIAVNGASSNDDNWIGLFNNPPLGYASPLLPLATEDDVNLSSIGVSDQGDEILMVDNLVIGQIYYCAVATIGGTAGNITVRLNALLASDCDNNIFTGGTNTFTSTCQNFKCRYRPMASGAVVHRWPTAAMIGSPDWTYTIPSTSSIITICQLGKIVAPNFGPAQQTVHVSIDVKYNLQDAAGNVVLLTAVSNNTCNFQLNPQAYVHVRSSDQCPAYKSASSAAATDYSVCGIQQYQWKFTQAFPLVGLPIQLNGSMGSRILPLSSVTGIANGQRYDVVIRGFHQDGLTYTSWTNSNDCIRTIGAAGIPIVDAESHSVLSANNGWKLFPNPSVQNGFSLIAEKDSQGELVLFNSLGQCVFKKSFEVLAHTAFPTEFAVGNGLYHVQIREANVVTNLEWIKQ